MVVAGGFLIAFLWSAKSGQFDDDYTPSVRILFDDASQENTSSKKEFPKTSEIKNEITNKKRAR